MWAFEISCLENKRLCLLLKKCTREFDPFVAESVRQDSAAHTKKKKNISYTNLSKKEVDFSLS